MTRISNSEQVLALVRAQLQRMAKRESTATKTHTGKPGTRPLSQREMIDALNSIEGLSDDDFVRGFVRALLTEEFGERHANSPEFQSVVDRTASVIQTDRDARAMLKQVRGG